MEKKNKKTLLKQQVSNNINIFFIDHYIKEIKEAEELDKNKQEGLVHLIGLSLVVYAHQLKSYKRLRNLQEISDIQNITDNINKIIENSHDIKRK